MDWPSLDVHIDAANDDANSGVVQRTSCRVRVSRMPDTKSDTKPDAKLDAKLDVDQSRARQRRLLDRIASHGLDALVLSQPKHAYYFSAVQPSWAHEAGTVIFADGRA